MYPSDCPLLAQLTFFYLLLINCVFFDILFCHPNLQEVFSFLFFYSFPPFLYYNSFPFCLHHTFRLHFSARLLKKHWWSRKSAAETLFLWLNSCTVPVPPVWEVFFLHSWLSRICSESRSFCVMQISQPLLRLCWFVSEEVILGLLTFISPDCSIFKKKGWIPHENLVSPFHFALDLYLLA